MLSSSGNLRRRTQAVLINRNLVEAFVRREIGPVVRETMGIAFLLNIPHNLVMSQPTSKALSRVKPGAEI